MKKFLAILLALACMLITCGATAETKEEPTVIRFMTYEHVHSIMNNDIMTFKTLDEMFNVTFEFMVTPDAEYNEKVNLMLSSADYPDIFRASPSLMSQYYDTGIVYCLDELIAEKVPNLYKACNDFGSTFIKNITSDDGHLWYFPKIEYSDYNIFPYINGDWLNELGLEVPTTCEELHDVLVAFKEAKGDDCIPWITGPWVNLYGIVFNYFGSSNGWLHVKEGEYVYGPYERADQFKNALAFMNQCYSEGLIDTDFLTRDDDSKNSLISQNKVGFFTAPGDNGTMWSEGGIDGLNFLIPAPFSGAGATPLMPTTNGIGNAYFVSTAAENKLDKIMEVMNFIYSDEGATLFSYGVEDVTYTVAEDGTKVFTDLVMDHELGAVNGRRQLGINPNPFVHVSLGTAWDALMHPESVAGLQRHKDYLALPNPVLSPTADEADETTQLFADISKYIGSSIPQFIVGDMSIEKDWDTFLKTLESLGIERYIEIIKGEYDRWLAR